MEVRLPNSFYRRDVLEVSPKLLGKTLVRQFDDGTVHRFNITETEAYRGVEDLACHASKGRTARTEIIYHNGGLVYVYLIYGMHWMLNFVAGKENEPYAVLIRGIEGISGPGRVGKTLKLDKSFYGEDLAVSTRIWVEDAAQPKKITTTPRIGIDYAGKPWTTHHWRYLMES